MNPELMVCGNIARDVIFGKERYGGCAPVIALNTTGLGISSGLISVIGKDSFSRQYKVFLQQNNISMELVDTSIEKLPECVVSSDQNSGTKVEWIDNGSHHAMENIKLNLDSSIRNSVVHLVSCPPQLAKKLAQIGITNLSYEPGPYVHTNAAYLDFAVIDKSRMLFFNEEEYQSALEISGLRTPRDFVAGSSRVLVITRSANGSDLYFNADGEFVEKHCNAIEPEYNIVDSTGAGDCYKAGFLTGYIRGRSLPECALIGSYMGAACLTQEGGLLPRDKISQIKVSFGL